VKADRREFRFIEGSSRKFWAIELDGKSFSVHFGRIGTVGQAKEKTFSSEDLAKREYDKLISEKAKGGYVEVDASSTTSTPTLVAAKAAAKAEPTVTATRDAGKATAVGKSAPGASPTLAPNTPVPAPDAELQRRVKLPDEDWARVRWRPLKPTSLPEPRSFDFEACLKQATSAFNGWNYRTNLAKDIPTRLSREEAWFWLKVLTTPSRQGRPVEVWLRAALDGGLPGDAQVREWAKDIANRHDYDHGSFHYVTLDKAPQTLRPFFAPAEIVDLIVQWVEASASRARWPLPTDASRWTMASMLGFSAFVLPQLSEHERSDFRAMMERRYDAEADPSSVRATALLAFLSTVGGGARLAQFAAGKPDRAWENQAWFGGPGSGHLDVLAGLPDEASFVREARRLVARLVSVSDLRLWLAATGWRELDMAKDAVLAARTKDEAAALARALALVEAPEAALPMLEVQLGSKAPAIAAEWLSSHPLLAAVGLVPAAMGHGKLAEAGREHLHTMRRGGLVPVLTAAKAHLTPEESAWLQREILDAVEEAVAEIDRAAFPDALRAAFENVKPCKPPGWLSLPSLPPIKVGGKRLAVPEIETVLTALRTKREDANEALTAALKQHADPTSLDAFVWKLFELWQGMGAPSKDKWAMGAIGLLGGDGCVLKLTPLVREWPGESQHARAVFGLECLRAVGSDTALMALNGVAQKLKFKGLKQKAQEMMEGIAQSRGFTSEQLADRIVPDCGLDERGSRMFDFGPRQFRFVLGPEMKPLVRDAAGKVRSDLPAPTKADDAARAEVAVAEWKLLKKTLREVLKIQADRLEDAMITGRRWTPEDFHILLVKHPLMVNLVRQLVLAAYDNTGKVTQTFRVTEDQTLADQNDEETALPSSGHIGVAHPAHLDEALKSAWGQVLSDYAIIPPFAQLGRDICQPSPEDAHGTEIIRYRGQKIPGIVMYGMLERSHWLRDTPADGGGFMQHSKHFPAANVTAFIKYTGLSIGYYEEKQELEAVYFVPGHVKPTWWGEHKNRLKIKDVDPVVLSEVLRLANAIHSKAE
jgi:predicted DNA-binding WGR domain protein